MQITSSRIPSRPYSREARPATQSGLMPQDNFTFSSHSGLSRLGKGVGGGVAGTLFSGLLFSLPLSLAPAFGVETQSALAVYKAAVLTAGVAGGLASAAMPPGKDWY
jgi:FtsH-binding integral membrane protein